MTDPDTKIVDLQSFLLELGFDESTSIDEAHQSLRSSMGLAQGFSSIFPGWSAGAVYDALAQFRQMGLAGLGTADIETLMTQLGFAGDSEVDEGFEEAELHVTGSAYLVDRILKRGGDGSQGDPMAVLLQLLQAMDAPNRSGASIASAPAPDLDGPWPPRPPEEKPNRHVSGKIKVSWDEGATRASVSTKDADGEVVVETSLFYRRESGESAAEEQPDSEESTPDQPYSETDND